MKTNEIRALLNATQEDMAIFLGVSRSHYSMFESGQRDLPLKASQLLATLLTQLQIPAISKKSVLASKLQQTKRKQHIQRLQHENEYQQLSVARKIAAATKKHETNVKRLLLTDVLSRKQDSLSPDDAKINRIMSKVSKLPEAEVGEELLELEIRLELLAFEKKLLDSKLKEMM